VTTKRTTPPVLTPISLIEAKAHVRVDSDDDDTLLTGLIAAAVAHLDGQGVLGRAMITQSWSQWVSQAPGWVRLTVGPFQSLTSVEYYDADNALQTATLTDFEIRLDGDFVLIKPKEDHVWPLAYIRQDAIKITYVAGFGDAAADVPENIRLAIRLLVGHFYENREAVSEANLKEVPLAVEALIATERVSWYGS
jgi:uncharacterized phiE125 gp8 family phage protein